MSAHIGDIGQWYWFEERARSLFQANKISVFHAKEFHDGDGGFAGWSVDRKVKFLDEFGTIANETLGLNCTVVLKMGDYREFYVGSEKPKKLPMDTAYGVCFRGALSFLADIALRWEPKDQPRTLNVVLEQGHKNAGDALRIYNEFKADLLPQYIGLLGSITFDTKEKCLPLAVSDLSAHSIFRLEEGHRGKWRAKGTMRSAKTYRKNHYRIEMSKDTLLELKNRQMKHDSERLAHGVRKKQGAS